ncbi:MAG: ester cyclase [Pseudomonadota bacterium]
MSGSRAPIIESANATLIAARDLDAVGDFFSADYTAHVTGRSIRGGHEVVRKTLGALFRAFASIDVDVGVFLEDGDRVCWQRTLKGTQTGSFKGFPASQREIVWRDMVTSQFEGGLISEEWVVTDLAEQLLMARKI